MFNLKELKLLLDSIHADLKYYKEELGKNLVKYKISQEDNIKKETLHKTKLSNSKTIKVMFNNNSIWSNN